MILNVFWISLLYGIVVVTPTLPQKDSSDSLSLRSEMNVMEGGKIISPKSSGGVWQVIHGSWKRKQMPWLSQEPGHLLFFSSYCVPLTKRTGYSRKKECNTVFALSPPDTHSQPKRINNPTFLVSGIIY